MTQRLHTPYTDDIRQAGNGAAIPEVLVRSHYTPDPSAEDGRRFVGADVHVDGWKVNMRTYRSIAGASRRAAREMEQSRLTRRGHFDGAR